MFFPLFFNGVPTSWTDIGAGRGRRTEGVSGRSVWYNSGTVTTK